MDFYGRRRRKNTSWKRLVLSFKDTHSSFIARFFMFHSLSGFWSIGEIGLQKLSHFWYKIFKYRFLNCINFFAITMTCQTLSHFWFLMNRFLIASTVGSFLRSPWPVVPTENSGLLERHSPRRISMRLTLQLLAINNVSFHFFRFAVRQTFFPGIPLVWDCN